VAKRRAIASLSVSLVARTKKFTKGIKKALRTVTRFTKGIRTLSLRVAKMGAAFTAVAIGGLALFIKQSFSSLDALAKASDRLGITADKLRGFERAAELTGSTIQRVRKGFIQLSKGIAEAAIGTGEALDALEALRLDAGRLIDLKPDEIFFRVAGALERIPSRIKKIGIVADLFGTRGVELLNLLELGEKQMRALVGDVNRLFGTLTRFDLFKIEQANDAFGDMLRSARGIADALAVHVAQGVEVIAKHLEGVFIGIREDIPSLISKARGFVIWLLNKMDELGRGLTIFLARNAAELFNAIGQTLNFFERGSGAAFANLAGPLLAFSRRQEGALVERRGAGATAEERAARGTASFLGTALSDAFDKLLRKATQTFRRLQLEAAQRQEGGIGAALDLATQRLDSIMGDVASITKEAVDDLNTRLREVVGKAAGGIAGRAGIPLPVTALHISPSRTFIPGLQGNRNRAQLVTDPQLARVIELMILQNRLIQRDGAVAVTN